MNLSKQPIDRPKISNPSIITVSYDQANKAIFNLASNEFWTKYEVVWSWQNNATGYPAPRIRFYEYPRRNTGDVSIALRGLTIYEENLYPDKYFWPDRISEQQDHINETYDSLGEGWNGVWTDSPTEFDSDDEKLPLEPIDVFLSHLLHVFKHNSAELLKRGTVHFLIEKYRDEEPYLVENVFPERVKPHILHQVMRRLLDDFISIKPLGRLLETLDANIDKASGIEELVYACKERFGDIDEYQFGDLFLGYCLELSQTNE